jgi:hypothetical protein
MKLILLSLLFPLALNAAYTDTGRLAETAPTSISGTTIQTMVRNAGGTQTASTISTSSWMTHKRDGKFLILDFHISFTGTLGSAGSPIYVRLPIVDGIQLTYDSTYWPNGAETTFAAAPRLGKGQLWNGSSPQEYLWYWDLNQISRDYIRAVDAGGTQLVDTACTSGRAILAYSLKIPIVGW